MNILMKAGEKITDKNRLDDWNDEKEEPFQRGHKPKNEPYWVYFVREGKIIGRAKWVCYKFKKVLVNIEGKPQEGNMFILKGPFVKPLKIIEFPKNIPFSGPFGWIYIKDSPEFNEIKNKISESFKD